MELEFVGTVIRNESAVRIFRQFDPVVGFQYFLEEDGELKPFVDAFNGYCSAPYPFMLDHLIGRSSVSLKVYHIEDDDWDAEIGGQKIKVWCEKAMHYYESDEELGCWREYWGLLKDERETLFYFFEKFFRKEKNVSEKEWWKVGKFRRIILNVSLGEYREKLIDSFIERLSPMLSGCDLEEPRNKAKGLLVWLEEYGGEDCLRDMLHGLYEWDYLTAEEREEMELAICERLEELAEKEENWAGLSVEDWADLLKNKLVKEKVIKDTDEAFWKWIKHYLERKDGDLYSLLELEFEGNVDWDWMPRKEKKELAEALKELVIEKLEEELRRFSHGKKKQTF
jgi:hypothetical protein